MLKTSLFPYERILQIRTVSHTFINYSQPSSKRVKTNLKANSFLHVHTLSELTNHYRVRAYY